MRGHFAQYVCQPCYKTDFLFELFIWKKIEIPKLLSVYYPDHLVNILGKYERKIKVRFYFFEFNPRPPCCNAHPPVIFPDNFLGKGYQRTICNLYLPYNASFHKMSLNLGMPYG